MLMKAEPSMNPADAAAVAKTGVPDDAGTPVSVKIRERIQAARKRFHSNDNIAQFIEPGELEQLLDEVEHKMQGVLDSLVIDTESDHNTRETARRVAKMYLTEVFRGRYAERPSVTEFPNIERLNELMIVGPITVRSACSHHLCPIIGKVWIGVLPNEHTNLIGLSKYARLTDWVMSRPQIQEEAVDGLAAAFEHLHVDVAAVAQDARDPERRIVLARRLQDRIDGLLRDGAFGAAGVEQTDEHGVLRGQAFLRIASASVLTSWSMCDFSTM